MENPVDYLTNVGSRDLAEEVVKLVAQQGIVHAVAQLPADQILKGVVNREQATGLMRQRLADMRTGLSIDQLTLDRVSAPLRVARSFDAVTTAESDRAGRILAAQQERAKILGEAAGEGCRALLELVNWYAVATERGDEPEISALRNRIDTALEDLRVGDTLIGGETARIINTAKTYRTQIIEQIATEAESFRQLLPQYRQNPRLVLAKLWEDAREQILTGDVETFYTVPGQLELQLNRDPELQKERQNEHLRSRRSQQEAAEANR